MSQPLSLSSAAMRVSTTGGVVNTAVLQFTGFTWPILLIYVGIGGILMLVSLHGLLAGEKALRVERKLFHGHTATPQEIIEDGLDWVIRHFNGESKAEEVEK